MSQKAMKKFQDIRTLYDKRESLHFSWRQRQVRESINLFLAKRCT